MLDDFEQNIPAAYVEDGSLRLGPIAGDCNILSAVKIQTSYSENVLTTALRRCIFRKGARPEVERRGSSIASFMISDQNPLGERVFLSADVARLAAVSLRQLQWWDERKLISPRKAGRLRVYLAEQVLEILTVAALRRKGLSLQKIRKVLRLLRRELGRLGGDVWFAKRKLYLITDGNSALLDDQPESVLNRIAAATKPMYLACLTDQVERIASQKAPRRYRTRQLPLF